MLASTKPLRDKEDQEIPRINRTIVRENFQTNKTQSKKKKKKKKT